MFPRGYYVNFDTIRAIYHTCTSIVWIASLRTNKSSQYLWCRPLVPQFHYVRILFKCNQHITAYTVAVVSPDSSIFKIKITLMCRAVFPWCRNLSFYLSMSSLRRAHLKLSDTMCDLLAGPLTHFYINCPLLGGSDMTHKCLTSFSWYSFHVHL